MRKIMWMVLVMLTCPLMAMQCGDKDSENCHTKILFHNNSDKLIYVDCEYSYPDTQSYSRLIQPYLSNAHIHGTMPGSSNNIALQASFHRPTCWEYEIRFIPSDTLMVFVFDGEMMESASIVDGHKQWDERMFLQRYDLSIEDLRRLDFQLHYPPTEAMRNMKMWPHYRE